MTATMATADEFEAANTRGQRGDGLNVPRDRLSATIASYAAEEQELVLWLHGYCMDRLGGSRSALCEFVGLDWTTLYRVFTGKYGAGLADFCKRIRHLRARESARSEAGFVETTVSQKIFAALDIVKTQNCIGLITGASGRSKTHSVREWQRRNNHGSSLYIDCPIGSGLRPLLAEIAERAGLGRNIPNAMLQDRLRTSFDYRHTLIFDEVARLLPAESRTRSLHPLEFIRRLNERSRCGIMLVTARIFPKQMQSGPWCEWFEQLFGRIEVRVEIPDTVSRTESATIAQAFTSAGEELDPALVSLVRKIANGPGHVRLAFTMLRHASMLAKAKKEPLSAAHLQAAINFRENINRWPEE